MARKRFSVLGTIRVLSDSLLPWGEGLGMRVFCFLLGLLLTLGFFPYLANLPVHAQQSPTNAFVQGEQAYQSRDYATAIQSLSNAATGFEQQGNSHSQAIALTNLGNIYLDMGQAEAALASWEQATAVFATAQDSEGVRLGQLYQVRALRDLGLFPRACAILGHTLLQENRLTCSDLGNGLTARNEQGIKDAISTLADQQNLQIIALKTLGDIMRLVGELEASQGVLVATLNLQHMPLANLQAVSFSLANTYRARGNLEKARRSPTVYNYIPWQYSPAPKNALTAASKWYAQAAQAYDQVINKSTGTKLKTQAQLNLLRLHIEGCPTLGKQCQFSEESNPIELPDWHNINLKDLPQSRTTIYSRINLAKSLAYFKQLTHDQAPYALPTWNEIEEQLAIAKQEARELVIHRTAQGTETATAPSGDNRAYSYALGNLAGLYEYCGLSTVTTHCDQSESRQTLLNTASQLTQEALLVAQPSEAPDIAYKWQWQLGRLLKQQKKNEQAIKSYETAVETLKSIRGDLLVINSDVQFNFRDNVEPLYRELVDLLLTEADASPDLEPFAPESKLEKALSNIDSLRLDELVNFMGCNLAETDNNVEQLAQEVDPNAAFIYPIILADRLDVVYKLPQQPLKHHIVKTVSHDQIEEIVNNLRGSQARKSKAQQVKALSQQVYSWLIEPLESEFESFADKADKTDISTLVFLLDGPLRNIPMSFLLDQDGTYLIEKYPVAVISSRQLFSQANRRSRSTLLAAGITESRTFPEVGTFSPLPAVEGELSTITAANQLADEPLLNQLFTSSQLETKIDDNNYSIVHIATHGEFNSDPEKTFIMAWDQLIKFKDFANVLQVGQGDNASAIDLLVLSACKTANGDRRAALGLAGAAAQANVRTTLATLWTVDDRATSEFMSKFYDNLQSGLTIAQAVQKTQLSFLEKSGREIDYRRPYYWAPFIIVGNWK